MHNKPWLVWQWQSSMHRTSQHGNYSWQWPHQWQAPEWRWWWW